MKILFVCLGNICRSPAAEGILRKKAEEIGLELEIESGAIGDWHIGKLPEERTRNTASNRGYILSSRAKLVHDDDFDKFDLILAADQPVLHALHERGNLSQKAKMALITAYSSLYPNEEIPDPYYGGQANFEHVLDMIEDSADGLIEHLKKNHLK